MLSSDQSWIHHYRPATQSFWQGRSEKEGLHYFHEIVVCKDLREPLEFEGDEVKTRFALVGFACDEGVRRNKGRIGAREGPTEFRKCLANCALQSQSSFILYDVGDIVCEDQNLESAQESLGKTIAELKKQNVFPIVIGGGHEVAWGHYQGIDSKQKLSIVNFDSHFDLRPLVEGKGNSGTGFTQIANYCSENQIDFHYYCLGIQKLGNIESLFQKAKSLGTQFIFAETFHKGSSDQIEQFIDEIIVKKGEVYLTICMDVFAAPYAPGVSAPEVLGLTPWQVIPFIIKLARSKTVSSMNLAELNPALDLDNRTSSLAAKLVAIFISHQAL